MRYQAALAVRVVFLLCGVARAGSPVDELRGFFGTATRILEDPELDGKTDERIGAIGALSREMFETRGYEPFIVAERN